METLKQLLIEHEDFQNLKPQYIDRLCECACKVSFAASSSIMKSDEPAEYFYIIETGDVAVEVFSPPKGAITILTLSSHDILGWSWLYPPYTWHFDARAMTDVSAYAFDAAMIRKQCHEDFEFGFHLSNCIGEVMLRRLSATRLQLLDIFGSGSHYPTPTTE